MKTVILKIDGFQSWGSNSKAYLRNTEDFPTFSGVIGLLQNVCGVYEEKEEELWDKFSNLKIDVMVEEAGQKEKDFHTIDGACSLKGNKPAGCNTKLSNRYFLTDALFYVAVYGNDELIDFIAEKMKRPVNGDLYFGRRCFPANFDFFQGLFNGEPEEILLNSTKKDFVQIIKESKENTLTTQIIMDRPKRNRKFSPRKICKVWVAKP